MVSFAIRLLFRMLVIMVTVSIAACGFQLRGTGYTVPFETLSISAPTESLIGRVLRQKIRRQGSVELVDSPQASEATIQVLKETSSRAMSVISSSGSVDQYELNYTARVRIVVSNQASFTKEREIQLRRILSYSDQDLTAKSSEEEMLVEDMAKEAANRVLRLLATAGLKK